MEISEKDRRPTVEIIYDEGCPNVEAARANLRAAFDRLGIRGGWSERESSSRGTPARLRGLGSPTILVDGRDVAGLESGNGAACRLYETEEGRRSFAPPPALIEKALVEAGLQDRRPNGWAPGLLVAPGVLVAFLPVLACAACWPAYAALLSALGVGVLASAQNLLAVTIAALGAGLAALAWISRRDRRPLLVGAIGAASVLAGKFWLDSNLVNLAGAGLLVAASLWSLSCRARAAAGCPSCVRRGLSPSVDGERR